MPPTKRPDPVGFSSTFDVRDRPCIGIFAPGYAGKTRFCATSGEYAAKRGQRPGWLILDRKTRTTVEAICEELDLPVPLMNSKDFMLPKDALKLAKSDDTDLTKAAYTAALNSFIESAVVLAETPDVEPIIIDSGTLLWDWIGYANLGRREGVKGRYWGPAKKDWMDIYEALKGKTVLTTFWAKDQYKNDERTGRTVIDGPPHINYATTTLVRLTKNDKPNEGEEKYSLDIVESIDNKAFEGVDGVLQGDSITYSGLMQLLKPEE